MDSPGGDSFDLDDDNAVDDNEEYCNDKHSSGLARVVQGGSTSDSDESDQVGFSNLILSHLIF